MMMLDPDSAYKALLARDARFDGRFFVGVSSTGIYCRPVCRVKAPKRENCTFYANAASAELKGFRPCMRCRPELAPGHASVDASERLARQAALAIEAGALEDGSLETLALGLGVTDRHLRRVFEAAFGVTPVAFAQTRRLLLAKQLLTDTDLPITDVAHAAGFQSVSRFNSLFKDRYRMSPSRLRKDGATPRDYLTLHLATRPPFDGAAIVAFLSGRTIAGVEAAEEGSYLRTVRMADTAGWVRVTPADDGITADISASLAPHITQISARLRQMFDLDADPLEISTGLGELARGREGLRVPGCFDGFEMAVRAILGQQVTVKAAHTMAGRVAAAFGEEITTPHAGLTRLFPTATRIAGIEAHELGELGVLRSRSAAIIALARAIHNGIVTLSPGAPVDETMKALVALPGIGPWTANYIAMRALRWPDAFPAADYGVKLALKPLSDKDILVHAENWRPWRAYATLHLWSSLEH